MPGRRGEKPGMTGATTGVTTGEARDRQSSAGHVPPWPGSLHSVLPLRRNYGQYGVPSFLVAVVSAAPIAT